MVISEILFYFCLVICVLFLGAKVRQEIYDAYDNIYPILKSFKKN